LFGGYLTYRADRIARHLRRVPRAFLSLGLGVFRRWPVSDEKIGFEYKAIRLLEGAMMSPETAHVYFNGTFSNEELNGLIRQPLPGSLMEILGKLRGLPVTDDLAPFLWFDQKYYLADDILNKSDRMSMAHSVEVRPPFLDHRIVEFAARLPGPLKIRGPKQKVVLRELMKNKLPTSILRRKKIGFDIPAHDWLRGPLRHFLEETIHSGLNEYATLFDKKRVERLMDRHFRREVNIGYHLWGLLILFLWMKRWRVTIPAA
jgi:asparagine synthase (glutamine-hydrolysing)